jgi:hypothetical protein
MEGDEPLDGGDEVGEPPLSPLDPSMQFEGSKVPGILTQEDLEVLIGTPEIAAPHRHLGECEALSHRAGGCLFS